MGNNLLQKIDDLPKGPFLIEEGESLRLELAFFERGADGELDIHVKEGSSLSLYLADFAPESNKLTLSIHLEENASCEVRLAVLSGDNATKVYVPNVIHHAPFSTALVSCYGIATEASELNFSGLSTIEKGAKKSSTRQEAKVILFDRSSKGAASPALKISENDVKAGHGASIGRLNDMHLFYLKSRGLTENEAKRLIILGYLKPIVRYFSDESVQQRIDVAIEKGVGK